MKAGDKCFCFFCFFQRMRYNGLVLCRVLIVTYLIIHECLRHHCNCYTAETRPTPHFAASICSYCYVNALNDVASMLLPFTDSREVICGSWAPRLFCRPASRSLTQIFLLNTKWAFVFAEMLSSRFEKLRLFDSHIHKLACMQSPMRLWEQELNTRGYSLKDLVPRATASRIRS